MYKHTLRKPKGYINITEPDCKVKEQDTSQCVHCGLHFPIIAGSNKKRGFCLICYGVTCGQQKCDACYPQQKWLDDMEASGKQPIKIITGYDSFNQVQFQLRVPVSKKKLKLPAHFNKKAVRIEEEVMTVNEANLQGIL